MSQKVKRLFSGFAPEHYDIELEPNPKTMMLKGEVTITGRKTGRPSQRLTFHQHGLKITEAKMTRHDKKGDQEFSVSRINHQRSSDEVRLHASQMLYSGRYTVSLKFEGKITRQMEGIYPCLFKQGGEQKKLLATQFESHHAREAFPCIDEPEAKATFKLSLITPHTEGEIVLSNTPIEQQAENKTVFETTPKMSTYLLAFVLGEMKYKESKTKRGIVVRAYGTPDNAPHLEFAADFAAKCLDFYEDYFGINYPLAKCDLVALPDFASGAMENWGLITFREQALLVDPANTPLENKQYIAMVIAHELTHQWFGNLVTMRWWTDLWLNEGFATWMSYLPLDHFYPEWQTWTQFVVDEQQLAFKFDALANTHPIEVPVNHPDEIRTIFDVISYEKGASSIHMLSRYLGADAFRRGINLYLNKHAYANTDTVDLWQALEDASGKPVRDFMAAWTRQAGFPLVRAHITDEKIHLTQEQFLVNPLERSREGLTETIWPVALEANGELPDLFNQVEADFPTPKKLLKLNRGQTSFFRAIYNASHLEKLAEEIRAGRLNVKDRLGLLADTFEAAKAGYTDTTSALHLLEAFKNEDEHTVWEIISGNLSAIRGLMDDEELRENMKPYVRQLVGKQLKRLGWEEIDGEPYGDKLLRPIILGLASVAEETSVVDEALRRFSSMNQPSDLPPDLRGIIYGTAAREGDEPEFEKMLKLHNESTSSEERLTLTAGLTNFKQEKLIKRTLELITGDDVRLQDSAYWIIYSFGNRYSKTLAWEWLVEHWPWLKENLGRDLSFARMPLYPARSFSDPSFIPKYQKFFESVMSPTLERNYKQGVEMLQWQSEWKKRDLKLIKKFFADKA